MDNPPEITDLDKVISPHLEGGRLMSYTSRYLTKPGDNYGSIMLSISAKVQQADGTIVDLPLVAKLPPLTNEMFWSIFKPEITSIRENAVYVELAPSVRQLQLDCGVGEADLIEVFAKSYGCRISLDEKATTLDRDAILVLENLQTSGYRAGKRQVMFDYDHTKLVLKYVAKYHALPIALRQQRPDCFKKLVTKFTRYDMVGQMDAETLKQFKDQMHTELSTALGDDVNAINRFKELDKISDRYMSSKEECRDGLFTTIAHFDLWINNVMILYDDTGAPNKLKVVDFQITQYESLVHDLIFLLLTSVETEVLKEHYHVLLKYYYNEFIECLEKTLCDTTEYSYDKFIDEVNRIAPYQITHAVIMAKVLLADDTTLPEDFKDYDMDAVQVPPSEALLQKLRDIIRLSQKFGFFW